MGELGRRVREDIDAARGRDRDYHRARLDHDAAWMWQFLGVAVVVVGLGSLVDACGVA